MSYFVYVVLRHAHTFMSYIQNWSDNNLLQNTVAYRRKNLRKGKCKGIDLDTNNIKVIHLKYNSS